MKFIFLAWICVSTLNASFSKSNGIVIDDFTKLEWQDEYLENTIKKASWSDSLIYCNELNTGGYNNWRLPNKNELKSIVDRGKMYPALDSIFTKVADNYYWTSTTITSDITYAMRITFGTGRDGYIHKTEEHYVRCVRGGN